MSETGSVLDEIVWAVFYLGVHVVDANRLVRAHTPLQLDEAWVRCLGSARSTVTRPELADLRPPEGGHDDRLFVWLQPRVTGKFSFVWLDLPASTERPVDFAGADWQPVHTLADWDGNRR